MTTLGQLLLALSVLGAFISIAVLIMGHLSGPKDGEWMTNAGYFATFAIFFTTTLSVVLLVTAFFSKNYTFLYVVENHSRDVSSLSWLFSISALWAGREGSLLFWAWMLSGFAAYMAWRRISVTDAVSNIGIAVLNFVQIFFLVAMFFDTNNPFRATPAEAFQAGKLVGDYALQGMNPLLQHWAMILHPPTLFIGYAGLTVPFAFALAALFVRDSSKLWVDIVGRVTVFSWLTLGIGIGLGAIWAYVVLGWGGYWGWDPVENASLLPWLTGVGLLHSFTVYRRRGGFKKWSVMMAAITFVFVLLGTFITRSGILPNSAHAFLPDLLSLRYFLAMMVISLVVPAVMLIRRGKEFGGADEFTSLISKEGSYYFNNVLMLFAAVLVAGLTLSPAKVMIGSLVFQGPAFNTASFDLLARPVGIFYVLLMTVCPILSWNATSPETFWKRAKWPLGIGAVLATALLGIWATVLMPNYQGGKGLPALTSAQTPIDHIEGVIGLIVAAFAIALPIYLFVDASRKRAAARGESVSTALTNIVFKSRTQSGGYLTHIGIGIVLIGLVGSTIYVKDVPMTVPDTVGERLVAADNTSRVGGYEFVYQGSKSTTLANDDVVKTVAIDIVRDGRTLSRVEPSIVKAANRTDRRFNAAVDVQLLRDVFLALQDDSGGVLQFDVKINPLISWAWVGFILMLFGTAIAAWPRKELPVAAAPAPAPAPKRKKRAA